MKRVAIILSSLLLLGTSCTDSSLNDGTIIGYETETLSYTIDGDKTFSAEQFDFTARGEWSAEVSTDAAEWLSVSPASGGAGNATLKFAFAENKTHDTRVGTITLSSEGTLITIEITHLVQEQYRNWTLAEIDADNQPIGETWRVIDQSATTSDFYNMRDGLAMAYLANRVIKLDFPYMEEIPFGAMSAYIESDGGVSANNGNMTGIRDEYPMESVAEVTIGSAKVIGPFAFRYHTMITKLTLPETLVEIGQRAFFACERIPSLTLHEGVTTIGLEAFCNNFALTTADLPSTVSYIGTAAFANCSNLTTLTLRAVTPPANGGFMFFGAKFDLQIKVPAESVEAYKSAEGWKDYAYNISAI